MEPPRITPHIRTIVKQIELRGDDKPPGQLYDKEGWFRYIVPEDRDPKQEFMREVRRKQFKHIYQSEPRIKRPTK